MTRYVEPLPNEANPPTANARVEFLGPTPSDFRGRLRQVGPGLIAAATGVGAGDLVATMIAGARFGTVLLWAAILGAVLKLALAEATGRWHLASGMTLLDGWRRLGYWATGFFGIYIVIWGFVYGATAMSAVGLPLNALFGVMSVRYWAMLAGLTGLVLVWGQRYAVFERFMTVLVAIKFFSVVATAILVSPNLGDLANGLVPRLPPGSTIYVLGLIGGVGGTITMAAYGYWMMAKGWSNTGWLSVMRLDNAVGYTMTAIFVVAMLAVGAEILRGQDLTESDRGLLTLGNELGVRYGAWARTLFLVGFFAVTWTSLLGVWNGVSLLFADWTRVIRLPHGSRADSNSADGSYDARQAERSPAFRFYLLWLTLPPMTILLFDRPFAVTLIYGVLGAAFMPFLALTLLVLLNSRFTPPAARPGWLSTVMLVTTALLFIALLGADLAARLG
jgi:Mn2+/Fe2+ NRAMP family transporter